MLLVGDEPEAARAISAGRAWGLLAPDASPDALQAAVRALAEGLVVASPGLAEALLALPRAGSGLAFSTARKSLEGEEPPEDLTPREAEVLGMAAQGLTNKQIALGLGISEHTVKFHMSAVFDKLNVSNRAEAVRKGARSGAGWRFKRRGQLFRVPGGSRLERWMTKGQKSVLRAAVRSSEPVVIQRSGGCRGGPERAARAVSAVTHPPSALPSGRLPPGSRSVQLIKHQPTCET